VLFSIFYFMKQIEHCLFLTTDVILRIHSLGIGLYIKFNNQWHCHAAVLITFLIDEFG
jgi:hypothetical protein